MNAIESIALNFLKKELVNNPQLAGNFLRHILEGKNLDPKLVDDLTSLVAELLPLFLNKTN